MGIGPRPMLRATAGLKPKKPFPLPLGVISTGCREHLYVSTHTISIALSVRQSVFNVIGPTLTKTAVPRVHIDHAFRRCAGPP